MGAHCITGYAGKEHITAADQGMYNAGTLGTGKYVLPIGSMFEAVTITNNLIKIKDGCLVNQGRNINIAVNDYEECEIDNGIQALKRNDLIVIRYEKNADTGIETASTIVIKGVSGETAVDPEYATGNIFNGDNVDDFPLYRVKLEGLNITAVEPLFNTIVSFKTLIDTVASLNKDLANLNTNLDTLSANLNATWTSPALYDTTKLAANGGITINKIGKLAILHADIGTKSVIKKNGAILNLPNGYRGGFNNIPATVVTSSGTISVVGLYTSSADNYSHVYVNAEIASGYGLIINVPYVIT